jgi:hypothetical protein
MNLANDCTSQHEYTPQNECPDKDKALAREVDIPRPSGGHNSVPHTKTGFAWISCTRSWRNIYTLFIVFAELKLVLTSVLDPRRWQCSLLLATKERGKTHRLGKALPRQLGKRELFGTEYNN